MSKACYEAPIVVAYLRSLMDPEHKLLNEKRMTESHREMLERWETWEVVLLQKVDTLLCRYDLMLWELDMWADEHFGRTGYWPYGMAYVK